MRVAEVFGEEFAADFEWLTSSAGNAAWNSVLHDQPIPAIDSRLDKTTARRRIEFLRLQRSFQASAKEKFPDPEHWFWTRKLLEQSSDHWCAAESANDFPAGEVVMDLCCGAGADAIALAQRSSQVVACDIDATALQLATLNAAKHQVELDVRLQPAETLEIPNDVWVHIDPDRRPGGARATYQHAFTPAWDDVQRLISQCRGISIKVAPGTRFEGEDFPPVVRFLSRQRSVRQQRWLWNTHRWPQDSIVVSAMGTNGWCHEVFSRGETDAAASHNDMHGRDLDPGFDRFIGDYDPGVRAAGVSALLAGRLGCTILFENGYLTGSEPTPHAMVRWFEVLEVMSLDRKKLAAYSRSMRAKSWELKSRGLEIDLDLLRKSMRVDPSSDCSFSLLCTRIQGKNRAVVAREVTKKVSLEPQSGLKPQSGSVDR
jgi:SAM-dependent methyltransferase